MEEYYLVCTRCNGYYELEDGESPDNFEFCQCGGELVLVSDIKEYFNNEEYGGYGDEYGSEFEYSSPNIQKNKIRKGTFFLVSLIIIIPLFMFLNGTWFAVTPSDNSLMQNHSILGSDNRGLVVKEVYATSNTLKPNSKTIAIVTGIHPRETLSKNVTDDLVRAYHLNSNINIVLYEINVTNNPDNYRIGRTSGEGLAADYILPDILKSNDDLVIICHNHRPGYGQGFYIATPEMDEKSVLFSESVNQSIPGFNYYKADNIKEHTTSAIRFSKPLASAGYRTVVYEIPEWVSYNEAYGITKSLIDKSFTYI
ncbi:MAG TPA: hypothetical protein VK426_07280 [Methanobacterium sp.]|nr:hypothetical protein [Methanobacterium sp.]